MTQSIYSNELNKAATKAAQKASLALQQLLEPETRLLVSDVEIFEKPAELNAKSLAERCIKFYQEGKIIVASDVKIYEDNDIKRPAGVMMMFIDQSDIDSLSDIIMKRLTSDEQRMARGMRESAVTEALNIIGNAYIEVVSHHFKKTIMSMVPKIISSLVFDDFIGQILATSQSKTYVFFNTELIVTKNTIRIPFVLAVALWK
jgi:chemotaxis protein CheY-P-specific phosphatase CheC